jgi:hypothetical protein
VLAEECQRQGDRVWLGAHGLPGQVIVASLLDRIPPNQAISVETAARPGAAEPVACMAMDQPTRRPTASLVLDADTVKVRAQDLAFQSHDGEAVVACGISRDALQDLGGYHRLNGAEDEVFHALRPEIERLASAKYRAGRLDRQGGVLVDSADILLYGFEGSRQPI